MSYNLDITINDFENICRTCLSREDLKPLHKKYLAEMLLACTVVKFAENDGLPEKICNNCINEVEKAFSFARRCETTDTILRKCIENIKSELPDNPSTSQIIEVNIKEEIVSPSIHHLEVEEVLEDYEYLREIKQEEVGANDPVKEPEIIYLPTLGNSEYMEEVNKEIVVKMELEEIENDDTVEENYQEDDDEYQDETYSDNPGYRNRRRIKCKATNSKIREGNLKDESVQPENIRESAPNNQMYQCETCAKFFESPDVLKRHQVRIHCGKKHTCEVCSKKFTQSCHLKAHMRIHTGEKPYTCTVCSKSFALSSKLKGHMRLHTGEKPHTCEVCSRKFTQPGHLRDHMRTHTGDMPYTCEVCGKMFLGFSKLKIHMRIHTGEKPYTCDVCSTKFTQASHLKDHMRRHTGEKPYVCEVCSKMFSQSSSLKDHMKRHTGENPYTCKVCSKTFTESSHLYVHKRIHKGEKTYTCDVCSKKFSRTDALKLHMRTHTGERPYTCEVCSKSFINSSNLKRHMRMHPEVLVSTMTSVNPNTAVEVSSSIHTLQEKDIRAIVGENLNVLLVLKVENFTIKGNNLNKNNLDTSHNI